MKAKTKKALIIIALIAIAFLRFRPCLYIGHCLDDEGHGHIDRSTEGIEEPYTYISYHGIAKEGEQVVTLDIYNPLNNYCDDTILVADYNTNTNTFSIR